MDPFEALACAHFAATESGNYNLDVSIPASHVEVVAAIGTQLSNLPTVKTYQSADGHKKEKIYLNKGESVWLFAYLLPSVYTESAGEDIHLSFGMGAAEGGGAGTPVGMLRIRKEALAGVPSTSISTSLFTAPNKTLIPEHVQSKRLVDIGLGRLNQWYILNGYLEESAQFLMLRTEGPQPQIAHLWNKEKQSAIVAGQGWGANCFVCMITAAEEKTKGVFTFQVGDPRKDATVTVGGPVP